MIALSERRSAKRMPSNRKFWAPALGALLLLAVGRSEAATQAPSAVPTCSPRLELDARWRTLSVRGLGDGCSMTVEELAALIERESGNATEAEVESLFLGRVVRFPPLGEALLAAAGEDADWEGERPPPPGEANRLAAEILARLAILDPVRESLAAIGFSLRGFECEKVLVVTDHPSVPEWAAGRTGRPYDAMCWIRLEAP